MYDKEQDVNISQLEDFPLKTRKTIQREHKRFLNSKYQYYPDIERLLIKRSFGLCGMPMEIYWDGQGDECSQNALWAFRKERFGIDGSEKCCVFHTAEYAGNKIMDYMPRYLSKDKKMLSFSMKDLSLEWMQSCIDDIFAFAPIWMRLPPSIAVMLAETMAQNGQKLPSSLQYMELSGEILDGQIQAMIQKSFHVQMANVYATKDSGPIAASCVHGRLHIFSENVAIEVIQDGKSVIGEEGDIYLTSLRNDAMSLVRMRTGDRGIVQSASCPCGKCSLILHLTQGRSCEFITTESGRKVSALALRSMAEYANEEVSHCLAHIRFRQASQEGMDVIFGVKPAFIGWEDEFVQVFFRQVQDPELRKMRWNFISINPQEFEMEMDEQPFFKICEGVGK